MALSRRSLKLAGFKGSAGPLGKRASGMLRLARSSWGGGLLGVVEVEVGLRVNQEALRVCCGGVLRVVSVVSRRANVLVGREVRVGTYSITNSVSSFSLVGEMGGPRRMGADSPLKRSPKILLGAWIWTLSEEVGVVLSLGTYAASDFARECRTLPFLPKAAAAGCAFERLDSSLAPNAGLVGGVTTLDGVVTGSSSYTLPSK